MLTLREAPLAGSQPSFPCSSEQPNPGLGRGEMHYVLLTSVLWGRRQPGRGS